MSNNKEESLPDVATSAPPPAKFRNGKKKGKGAAKKSTESYRARRNDQQLDAFTKGIEAKYGLFESDRDRKLDTVVSQIQLTPQAKAVPVSVTTRAVGFSTAIVYQRSCTTWSLQAISEIATIHQVYRVHIMLFHLKVYLAQQQQSEQVSVDNAFTYLTLQDAIREQLQLVTQVPSVIAMILDCVGKATHDKRVWHVGYPDPINCESRTDYRSLIINPDTIVELLQFLSSPDSPAEERLDFIAHNSIPGSNFINGLLVNSEEVWPQNYGVATLMADIHHYKNWVNRVAPRLPSHAFPTITWSGLGGIGLLWSTERLDIRLQSTFTTARIGRQSVVRPKRSAGGHVPAQRESREQIQEPRFMGCSWTSTRAEFWSCEETSHANTVIGTASLVGEVCCIETRHGSNGHQGVLVNPILTIVSLSDAPR